jgi:hypothetical protein
MNQTGGDSMNQTERVIIRFARRPGATKEAKLYSKRKLFQWLEENGGPSFKGVAREGLNHKKIGNETYGRKSMIYVYWDSPQQRKEMEEILKWDLGFKITKYDPPSVSSIQVSYFKGHHWDE